MHALVTGGNGHLGINLVDELLAHGHRVRASVRALADGAKTAPLRALGAVELCQADVREPAAMRAALQGVDQLFHVAAVYSITQRGREAEMLDTALRGTETVLRAAAEAGVKRVVMTSSVVTLPLTEPGAAPVTEADWNPDLRVPYFRAKCESEQLAWRLAQELGLQLATILPAGIIGPGFAQSTPTIDLIQACRKGAFRLGAPQGNFGFVDARDVATAHRLAAERGAGGRFIVAYEPAPSFAELVRALGRVDARIKAPLMELPRLAAPLLPWVDRLNHHLLGCPRIATPEVIATSVSGRIFNFSSQRARQQLGWAPRVPFEQSLRETLETLKAQTG
ncbi:NAD-dependent epimerase/dehydratase family protein [Inhella proteolytica]|uniref:NAD-dependent epimerase/dehydratase family protein n=1 Tax=Inhella proteolytica TaxID=2795029 RepID=A0A931IZ80_9BURK|nr:NAD-dependent epimerase/dehydratase family protein [Inhella proteolytica]MBH9575456.1 NAD-dependent epimerase/dehydratase family protein [Inhella proteolytica]